MFFSLNFGKLSRFHRDLVAGFQYDLLAIFLFLVLVLAFFYRFLTGSEIFAFKDLSRYFYPLRYLMAEQVKSGILPLWNPYIFCGFPLMASLQVGFFYPLTVIYYLLPFNLAFNYYIIIHYFLAACFMYALLQHYQLSRIAAFFGGLVFAFSGYLLSVSNMNTSLSSVVWLPLLVLVWDRVVSPHPPFPSPRGRREWRVRDVLFLSILLAIMFLGGEPTILYVTLWFLVFYALAFSQKWMKSMAFLFSALLLALGLVAVQLLPFIELSLLSDRVVRTQFELVSFRSFPLREVLTFVFPYFFGNPAQFGGYTETLLGKTYQDWLISPYLGILPLIFVLFSFSRNRKRAIFLFAAELISLFLAFGKYTPFYKFVYQFVPGISMIRYPVKYLFLTTFCLTLLSAMGFEEILKIFKEAGSKFKKALVFFVLLFVLSLTLSLTGYLFAQKIYGFLAQKYSQNIPIYFFELLAKIIQFNLQSLINLTAYLFIVVVLFWMAYRGKIRRSIFVGGLLLVTAADLFANGTSIALGARKEVFSKPTENYAILLKDRGFFRFFYTPKVEIENRVIYGENYGAALLNAKDNFAANWHIPHHFFDFMGYESIKPMAMAKFAENNFIGEGLKKNFKYLSLFNVKYIVSIDKLPFSELKLLRHKYKYGLNVYLYENKKVLPRAYLLNAQGKPDLKLGRVAIKKYQPNKIAITVISEDPGFLFLSEAYYPGWKVFVDGSEKKIIKANDLFRAVELSAGRHEVKFVYDPLSFRVGAGISSICLLLTVICLLLAKRWGG